MPDYRAEDVTLRAADWVKRNRGTVAALTGLVAIIAVVLVYGQLLRSQHEQEARLRYASLPPSGPARLQKLSELVGGYGDTSVGVFAELDFADELFHQRRFSDAETVYTQVLTQRGAESIYGMYAKLNLAYCAQELRDYEKARKLYEEVKTVGGPYTSEAEHMLELLKDPPVVPMDVQLPVTEPTIVPQGQPSNGTGDDGTN